MLQHGTQVFEIEQQHAVVVGNLEDDIEHAHLRVVQTQHAANQQRSHVGDGGAHRVALLTKYVPQRAGAGMGLWQSNATLLQGGCQFAPNRSGLTDAGQVPLDVGQKHRYTRHREAFCNFLECDGLASAGGSRDQTMAVGHAGQDGTNGIAALGDG